MTGRDAIYAKLRKAVALTAAAEDARVAAVQSRLAMPPRHMKITRIEKTGDDRRVQFKAFLEGQSASFVEVTDANDVPAAISKFLRASNLPQRVRVGGDSWLGNLEWSRAPALERRSGKADPGDEVGVSHAVAGVSETGTLVLASGPDNPVTINFLPETHVVVIEEKDLVGGYEDAFARVRERYGKGVMPRTVNFISGPSRTGDIGGKLVMGAHGPRRMCVVLVRS